jgi:hypothetical protein
LSRTDVATSDVTFFRSHQEVAKCRLETSGIHRQKLLNSTYVCLQAPLKSAVLFALNKFKFIGLEFDISTNQIIVW